MLEISICLLTVALLVCLLWHCRSAYCGIAGQLSWLCKIIKGDQHWRHIDKVNTTNMFPWKINLFEFYFHKSGNRRRNIKNGMWNYIILNRRNQYLYHLLIILTQHHWTQLSITQKHILFNSNIYYKRIKLYYNQYT